MAFARSMLLMSFLFGAVWSLAVRFGCALNRPAVLPPELMLNAVLFTEPGTLRRPRTVPCKTLMFGRADASAAGFSADRMCSGARPTSGWFFARSRMSESRGSRWRP
jgi:hypothetical protein